MYLVLSGALCCLLLVVGTVLGFGVVYALIIREPKSIPSPDKSVFRSAPDLRRGGLPSSGWQSHEWPWITGEEQQGTARLLSLVTCIQLHMT